MKPIIFILIFQFGYFTLVSQNNSIRFESGKQYLEVAHHSSLNHEKITIEFWLKIYDTGNPDIAGGEQTILDKRGNNNGYNLRLAGPQFPLPIFTILDPGENAVIGDKVAQGFWQHIAIAIGKDTVSTYFNGALQEKKFIENFNLKSDSPLRIGQVLAYPGLDLWMRGEMDEFRVWDHVRSSEEINQHKHTELTGEENGLVLYFDFNSSSSGKILDRSTNSNYGQMIAPPTLVTSEAPVGYVPLSSPAYLLAYGLDDAIILEWKAVNETAQYQIFRTDNPDSPLNEYVEISTAASSAQTYLDTDIDNNTYYFYYIQAVDNEGNKGIPSNTSTSKSSQIINYNTGVYYYPWYGPNEGGHTWDYHRGVTIPKQTPILGEHSSRNKEIISTHMRWMKEYDIDFLVSSWWGKGSWEDITLKDFMLSEISSNERKFSIYFELWLV
jgi:hypothetical protein